MSATSEPAGGNPGNNRRTTLCRHVGMSGGGKGKGDFDNLWIFSSVFIEIVPALIVGELSSLVDIFGRLLR